MTAGPLLVGRRDRACTVVADCTGSAVIQWAIHTDANNTKPVFACETHEHLDPAHTAAEDPDGQYGIGIEGHHPPKDAA